VTNFYAFTSYLGLIIELQLQPISVGFLKIDALQDNLVLFTSKSFLLFLNGRGPHNPFEEKRLTRNERIDLQR